MASTEEVLKALQNAKIATLAATEPEELVIDAESRTITVPSSERLFGVTGDMNIERKYFRCPKIVGDNVDLSTHQIFIAYVYTETESGSIFPSIGVAPYHCEDVEVDGEDITFSWKLTGNVFKNPGFILFKMYAKRTETDPNTVFNTTPAIGTVLATIPDGTEEIVEEYPDVIAQIFDRLDALESGGGGGTGGTTNYNNLSNKPRLNGVTLEGNKTLDQVGVLAKNQGASNSGKFLSVGSDGNVVPADAPSGGGGGSGTPGKDGREIQIQNNGTAIQWRYVGDESWTDLVQLSDITGAKGDPGEDGITPTIEENGNWYLGETDTGKPSRGEKGPAGQDGNQGPVGQTGATPNIQIGTVQTLEPGQQATASMTGTPENPILNIGIPKGEKGDPGESSEGDPYTLPIMSSTQLGGGKAVEKTDEDVPVAVDPSTGQLFVPTYPENTGGDTINVDAELKEYMNVAKPAIASAIINKGGSVEPDDSLNDYATRISAIPNDIYPAETLPAQTNLSASGLQETIGIKLNWSNVNASGYLILRKENAMPATSADGDIVYNGTYVAGGYTDTGVQKGKVYYYRIFPRNSKNQYQSLEDGAVAMVDYKDRTGETLLGDLPLGSKIKFGQYSGADYFWEIVDMQDKASGFVTVAADQNLGNRQFDAPEPNSPISNRKTQGNNRWAYSAVRQLLNSEADTDAWWTPQYEYDAEPSYAAQIPGFLKDFTTYEKGIIVTKTNKCILPNDDGGGTETVQDKFWFPSYYAMGLGVIQPLEDNHIYEKFVDNESRSYQSSYWLRSINGAESPSSVRSVNASGAAGNVAASNYGSAVRPFCQLPTSAYMTWSDSDEAYVFADDSQRNPSAT